MDSLSLLPEITERHRQGEMFRRPSEEEVTCRKGCCFPNLPILPRAMMSLPERLVISSLFLTNMQF